MAMPLLLLLPVATILGAVTYLGEVLIVVILASGVVVIVEPANILDSWRLKDTKANEKTADE